jgi:hypothetical protein
MAENVSQRTIDESVEPAMSAVTGIENISNILVIGA